MKMMQGSDPPYHRNFRFRLLCWIASVTRKIRPPKVHLFLKLLHAPGRRWFRPLRVIANYDRDLLIHVDTGSYIEWQIFFYGYYEQEVANLIQRLVSEGSVALDVGANIGGHTLLMAKYASASGRVIAIEPNPKMVTRLRANIALNRMDTVELLQCGLSDEPGTLPLYIPTEEHYNQGQASFSPEAGFADHQVVDVFLLDDVVRERGLSKLDFIKIDTEGHDFQVIVGGSGSIRQFRPHILFEYDRDSWKASGQNFQECHAFFESQDYALYVVNWNHYHTPVEAGLPARANILAIPE